MKLKSFALLIVALVLPFALFAQDGSWSGNASGLQAALSTVYTTMIAKCGELIKVGQALAGFAATFYIGYRVWGHIARAEAIDFFPLFRPFVIFIVIGMWSSFITLFQGILAPTVTGTASLVTDSNNAITTLLQQRQDALKNSTDYQMYVGPTGNGDLEKWESLSGEADDGLMSGLSNRVKFEMSKLAYNFKNEIKVWLSEILQMLFEAAALCINTVRTFYLIILAILGPLVLGLSTFDGFHHIVNAWFAKYVNVYLWLPVCNIFGSVIGQIQVQMLQMDIKNLQATGQTNFGPTDAAYIVFLILGIVGYTTVPTITNFIINSGHHNAHLQKVTDGGAATASSFLPSSKQNQ